jgi:fimbrial chaperone protein
MRMKAYRPLLSLLLASLVLASGSAQASGLQVSPVSLTLKATQNADGLWLSNTGDDVIHAQVRVYRWTEQSGEQQLVPSHGLVVSPPMLAIEPGQKQLIRVIRVGAPPNGAGAVEDAYRLAIDELPIDVQGKKGLQFVLHYSLPVFVEPAGTDMATPQLHWSLHRDGGNAVLEVSNSGSGHAQLSEVSYTNSSGRHTEINGGLLGYILPGATMHWTLKQPATEFAGTGTFEARINGAPATQTITLGDSGH